MESIVLMDSSEGDNSEEPRVEEGGEEVRRGSQRRF